MNRVIKFRAWNEFLKYEIGEDGSVWTTAYKNTKQRREMKKYLDVWEACVQFIQWYNENKTL